MSSSSFQLTEEYGIFDCAICFSRYTTPGASPTSVIPLVLPCGHTFCRDCLGKLRPSLLCPKCRTSFTSVDSLGKNFILLDILALPEALPTQSANQRFCDECGIDESSPNQRVRATMWCQHEGFLCESHCNEIHSRKTTRGHPVMTLSQYMQQPRYVECQEHRLNKMYYCMTDQSLCCDACFVNYHKGHDRVLVAKASKTTKDEMVKVLNGVTRKRNELEEQIERCTAKRKSDLKAIEELKQKIDDLQRSVNQHEEEIDRTKQQMEEVDVGYKVMMKTIEDLNGVDLVDKVKREAVWREFSQMLKSFKLDMKKYLGDVGWGGEVLVQFQNVKDKEWNDKNWLDRFVQEAPKKKVFRIVLKDDTGNVRYLAEIVQQQQQQQQSSLPLSNSFANITQDRITVKQNVSTNHQHHIKNHQPITLSDGNLLVMIGKNGSKCGWGGSYNNGYAVIIVSEVFGGDFMGNNNIVLMVLPYRHSSYNSIRDFKGWSLNHEICFKNGQTFGTHNDTDISSCGFLGELIIYGFNEIPPFSICQV